MPIKHSLQTAIHKPYAAVYADSTERLAATGFVRAEGGGTLPFDSTDLYKIVLQLNDASEWILTAITPTWVQVSGAGSLANDSITNSLLANMATQTIKGRTTAGSGDPEDLTATQATAILNAMVGDSGSGGTKGLVPAPGAGDAAANKFLKADGTFAVPAGGVGGLGDVVGPASATDNALVRFDTTTGKLIQNSPITVDDNGGMTLPEIAAPSTPSAGKVVIYAKSDNKVYRKGEDGVEAELGGGGTVPGSNKYIVFNDGGAFGAVSTFSYDKTAHVVTLSQSGGDKLGWSNTAGGVDFGCIGSGAVGTLKVTADGASTGGTIYSPLTAMTDVGGNPRPFLGLAGQVQEFAMTTNRSLGQVGTDGGSAAKDGTFFTTIFTQDATGSRLLTWHSSYKFPGGTSIPLSTGANAIDIFIWLVRNSGSEAHLVYHSLDSK